MRLNNRSKYYFAGIFLLMFLLAGKTGIAQTPADSTATADSILLKQIEAQMQATATPEQPQTQRSGISANPDIGVIGDFQTSYISKGKKNLNAYLNETEVS